MLGTLAPRARHLWRKQTTFFKPSSIPNLGPQRFCYANETDRDLALSRRRRTAPPDDPAPLLLDRRLPSDRSHQKWQKSSHRESDSTLERQEPLRLAASPKRTTVGSLLPEELLPTSRASLERRTHMQGT